MQYLFEDIYLDWSEHELPQKIRTKHVHGLHPYLGKFVPQIPEIFLKRLFKEGDTILDPFMGSGTTLIEANILGMNSVGIDISAFNCLLVKVKTDEYDLIKLKYEVYDALERLIAKLTLHEAAYTANFYQESFFDKLIEKNKDIYYLDNEYINNWYSERAKKELLTYKHIIENENYEYKDVLRIILSRSARSARLCAHNELDWPKEPVREPYYCSKHRRICYPTDEAFKFIKRYSDDVIKRITEFQKLRTNKKIDILHGDSRKVKLNYEIDGIFTSPPYCGLIDYHLQHEYAYHFLGLEMLKENEIGPKEKGNSKKAQEEYKQGMIDVFKNCVEYLKKDGLAIIVVNDKMNLYPEIIEESGLKEEYRLSRKVNRRTGRRSTDFTEDIIICKKV